MNDHFRISYVEGAIKWLLLAPSSRPVHRIEALPLVFALGLWPFNEAQVICRQRLFSEGVFASIIQKYGIFGLFWPLTMASAATRLPIEPFGGQKLTPGADRSIDGKLFSSSRRLTNRR